MTAKYISEIFYGKIRNPKNDKKKETLLKRIKSGCVKKAALFFFQKPDAGLTIEAAISFSLFMFFSIFLTTFLLIMSLQVNIQVSLDDAARSLDRKAYMAQRSDAGEVAINTATIPLAFWDDTLKNRVDRSGIKGGSGGVSLLLSTYNSETGILDIVANYDYDIPFLPEALSNVHLSQRSRSRAWIGKDLEQNPDGNKTDEDKRDDEKRSVYITETGSVYHTSKKCHYLDLSIRQTDQAYVSSLRNKSGAKYYGCPLCSKGIKDAGTVYITDYGDNWHTSLSCSGLKRTIIEKDISEVKDMPACSKCGGSH